MATIIEHLPVLIVAPAIVCAVSSCVNVSTRLLLGVALPRIALSGTFFIGQAAGTWVASIASIFKLEAGSSIVLGTLSTGVAGFFMGYSVPQILFVAALFAFSASATYLYFETPSNVS